MAEHAILSASGSHRWLNCPPSARWEQEFADCAGISAAEGTFAHEYAEKALSNYYGALDDDAYGEYLKAARQSEFFGKSLEDFVDEYVSMVIEKVGPTGRGLLLERRLDYSKWVPGGFGRGDAIIFTADRVEVCDLKYGANVPVRAEGNTQLRLYGLGAYELVHNLIGLDIKEVQMTICQPRNGGISTEIMPLEDLLAWGESIKPTARLAFEGKGEAHAGDWCRFCKAAPRCRVLEKQHMAMEEFDFKAAGLMSDAEVADVLARIDPLVSWANKVKKYAKEEARQGRAWPGWKLVEGSSNRKYLDEDKVVSVLVEKGYKPSEFYKPTAVIGITDMEKLLGKKRFGEVLGKLVIKPPGAPVLVPESDPREALGSEIVFEDLDAKG